ncbi:MAG: DNA circularization N-terminal domain-containing protein [Leptospirales bacterium]
MAIELAEIELKRVHRIVTQEPTAFVRHAIPGMDGDMVQNLGRGSVRLLIEGIFYGPEAANDLEKLRGLYRKAQPVEFLAEITGQSYFGEVTLEDYRVWQLASEPDQYSYTLTIAEYLKPPEPETVEVPVATEVESQIKDLASKAMDLVSLPKLENPLPALEKALADIQKGIELLALSPNSIIESLRPVFGLVEPKAVEMSAVDEAGNPVPDMPLYFIDEAGEKHKAQLENGKLEMKELPPGSYRVVVGKE